NTTSADLAASALPAPRARMPVAVAASAFAAASALAAEREPMRTAWPAPARRRARPAPRAPVPPMIAIVAFPATPGSALQLHVSERDDRNIGCLQGPTDAAGDGHASRLVAVHAQGVHRDLDGLAAQGNDLAIPHHPERLFGRGLGVLEHAARDCARGEVAVILVAAVGKAFERHRQTQLFCGLLHLGAEEGNVDDAAIHGLDGTP